MSSFLNFFSLCCGRRTYPQPVDNLPMPVDNCRETDWHFCLRLVVVYISHRSGWGNLVAPGCVESRSRAGQNVEPVESPVNVKHLTGLMSSQILYGAVGRFASIGDTLQICLHHSDPAVDLIICRSLKLLIHWQTPTPIYLTMRVQHLCPLRYRHG